MCISCLEGNHLTGTWKLRWGRGRAGDGTAWRQQVLGCKASGTQHAGTACTLGLATQATCKGGPGGGTVELGRAAVHRSRRYGYASCVYMKRSWIIFLRQERLGRAPRAALQRHT